MKRKLLCLLLACFATLLHAQSQRNYTVVISLDGCRWDYPQTFDTPFFDWMASQGVESGLLPSFPSKTFPNHYALATGLYPDHHGIIANKFLCREDGSVFSLSNPDTKFNPKFYGGEPIWITAQKQGLHTAVFYWPGSDVKVKGMYPDKYYLYDQKPQLTFDERVNGIIEELKKPEENRPQLIMAYFEQPDYNGHLYGPLSKLTRSAAMSMDSLMQRLYSGIQQLPIAGKVNFIVLSDHGMTLTEPSRQIPVKSCLKKEWLVQIEGDVPANIYVQPDCEDSVYNALKETDHVKVWKRKDIPAYLHYGSNENVGDIVVLPDLGWLFTDEKVTTGGVHGYDHEYSDMQAMFRAVGPDFKHIKHPHLRNVNVYPLLCHLLGIAQSKNDGCLDEIRDILK
ncbi:MAG: alkaline phosphatase family protein [Prevotella sp.]|nr:alkaline phosphatase family protein [Prevotella sp.]